MKIGIIGTGEYPMNTAGLNSLPKNYRWACTRKDIQWSYTIRNRHSYRRRSFTGWILYIATTRNTSWVRRAVHLRFNCASWMFANGISMYCSSWVIPAVRSGVCCTRRTPSSSPTWTDWSGNAASIRNRFAFFLKYAERLAVKYSDYFIADAIVMHSYLKNKFQVHSEYIAYGAEILTTQQEDSWVGTTSARRIIIC